MAAIKLTPFYLFLILLIVLVISILFGYSVSSEAFTNSGFGSSTTTNQNNIPTANFAPYSTSTSLFVLDTNPISNMQVLYDINNGNIVVVNMAAPATNTQFLVINRNGTQQTYISNNGNVTRSGGTMANDLQQTPTIAQSVSNGSPEYSWTYGNLPSFPLSIMYATWANWTLIYVIDAQQGIIKNIYRAMSTATQSGIDLDPSVTGTTIPLKNSNELSPPSKSTIIALPNGKDGYEISQNKYYNFDTGLIIKNAQGEYDTYSTLNKIGTNTATYDNPTQSMVIVSSLFLNNTNGVLIGLITYNSSNASTPFNLFITSRIRNNTGELAPSKPARGGVTGFGDNIAVRATGFGGTDNYADHSSYILKTEVVPPVCPMCPTCAGQNTYPLSVNASGAIVDCSGNVIMPAPTPAPAVTPAPASTTMPVATPAPYSAPASSPSTFGQGLGSAYDTTVSTAGGIAQTALTSAEGAVGDVTGLAGGLGKDITGLAGGLASDVTGLVGGTIGTAAGLLKDAGGGATGLLRDAGEGVANLANNAAAQQQYPYGYAQPYGYGAPYYGQVPYGQPQGYPQGYPVAGYPYGQPQGACNVQSSNFMPITNDFSQFAK